MNLNKTDEYLIERFGMTAEAMRRVMKNHKAIVTEEAREIIRHADFYIDPTNYVENDDLPSEWDEKDEDDDGYPNLYQYGDNAEKIFKDLISFGTSYGGMGSAREALRMMEEE